MKHCDSNLRTNAKGNAPARRSVASVQEGAR